MAKQSTGSKIGAKRLPHGMRYPKEAPRSEKGTNAGKSRFGVVCPTCYPNERRNVGRPTDGYEFGGDPDRPPKICPKGHPMPKKGYTTTESL